MPSQKFTRAEEARLWRFLAVNPERLTFGRMLEKYRLEGHTDRSQSSLNNRLTKYLVHSLHDADIDMVTKAQIYMIYKIRPTPQYLVAMREDIGVAVDEHGYVVYYNGMEEAHEEREETMDTNRIGVNESDGEESDGEPPINESIVHHEEIVADVANGDEKAYEEASSTSVVAPKRSGSPLLARSAKHYKTGESSSNHQVEDYETPEDDECQNGVSFSNNSTSLSTQQQLEISQFQPLLAAVQKTVHEVFAVEAKKMVTLVLDEQKKRSEAEKKSSLEEEKVSMTSYIKGLKRLVANMNSPSLDNIELRIDNALVALYDKDESVSIDSVRSVLDVALKMCGH